MAHHNTIPNSATYIHLHTPTRRSTLIVATLFFSLPLTASGNGSWWCWQHDGTSYEDQRSSNNITTYQCAPCPAGYFRISVYLFNGSLFWFNNIFLNDLCHYMPFSINKFPANIYIFITHRLAQASNIHTLFTYGLSPRFYFFRLVPILCASIIHIHTNPTFSVILYWIPT